MKRLRELEKQLAKLTHDFNEGVRTNSITASAPAAASDAKDVEMETSLAKDTETKVPNKGSARTGTENQNGGRTGTSKATTTFLDSNSFHSDERTSKEKMRAASKQDVEAQWPWAIDERDIEHFQGADKGRFLDLVPIYQFIGWLDSIKSAETEAKLRKLQAWMVMNGVDPLEWGLIAAGIMKDEFSFIADWIHFQEPGWLLILERIQINMRNVLCPAPAWKDKAFAHQLFRKICPISVSECALFLRRLPVWVLEIEFDDIHKWILESDDCKGFRYTNDMRPEVGEALCDDLRSDPTSIMDWLEMLMVSGIANPDLQLRWREPVDE